MGETDPQRGQPQGVVPLSETYLTFQLEELECAVPVGSVTEIIRCPALNQMPGLNVCYHGVVNLRSQVIPVLDTHFRLGRGKGQQTKWTPIIVLEVDGDAVGILVDAVTDVAQVTHDVFDEQVRGADTSESYPVKGMARLCDRLTVILDPDRLVKPPPPGEEVALPAMTEESVAS